MLDGASNPNGYARERYRTARLMSLARIGGGTPPTYVARARKCVRCKETKQPMAFAGPRWRVCLVCEGTGGSGA